MEMFNCGHVHTFVRVMSDYPMYEAILKKSFIIVPLRDPVDVWRSWINRFEQTDHQSPPLHLFNKQWEAINLFSHEFPLWYFPVDKVLESRVGHVENDKETDHLNAELYPQPYWDYIYDLSWVGYFYQMPEYLAPPFSGIGRQHLALKAKEGGVGCELGVAGGDLTQRIMELDHFSTFHAVDKWDDEFHTVEEYKLAKEKLKGYDKVQVHRADAIKWLEQQPDASLDFVYIDCYAHTGQDDGSIIEAAWPKMVPGGLFSGDDYNEYLYPETYHVVKRFAAEVGREINIFDDHLGALVNRFGDDMYDVSPSWYFYK